MQMRVSTHLLSIIFTFSPYFESDFWWLLLEIISPLIFTVFFKWYVKKSIFGSTVCSAHQTEVDATAILA